MTKSTDPPLVRGKKDWIVIGILCALFTLECTLVLNDTMIYTPDSINYLVWARSLSALKGFTNDIGPTPEHYVFNAPLYPVLLAPVVGALKGGVIPAKLATLAMGVFTLALFYLFLRRSLTRSAAWTAAAFLVINPLFILFSSQVLSDVPFGACLLLTLILLEMTGGDARIRPPLMGVMILVACASVLLREVGFALVLALAVSLARRKQMQALLLLLIAFAVSYGLWFIRNEMIVARAEDPGLRNIALVFSHVYTPTGSPFLDEITSRITRSAQFYGPALGNLIVAPFALPWTFSVTDSTDKLLFWIQNLMAALAWPLEALTVGALVLGARRIMHRGTGAFLGVFLPAFAAIIVLYPVSDVRFLFPILLLFLWGVAEGLIQLLHRPAWVRSRTLRLAVPVSLVLFAIPNLAWDRNVTACNLAFRTDPAAFAERTLRDDPYPNELLLTPRTAANWVAAHSASTSVVGSKSMASGIWLEGRVLLVINPLSPVEDFDNKIRDYHVGYLVCSLQAHAVPDFFVQMVMSTKSQFLPEFSFGDVEVFRIEPKTDPAQPSVPLGPAESRGLLGGYLRAVIALANGQSGEALARFESLGRVPGLETSGLFYTAIAQEFVGNLDSAETLFARFRTIPQSAAYVQQAQFHEDIIALLKSETKNQPPDERAALLHAASIRYWILGFRAQAILKLRDALRLDPDFFAGNIFGAIYSLAVGDTAGAHQGVMRAERRKPRDPFTLSLRAVLSAIDSLPRAPDKGRLELEIGRRYASMGLYEMGIDQAYKALRYGDDPEAFRMLADLYEKKERRAPALEALHHLAGLQGQNRALQEEIRTLTH